MEVFPVGSRPSKKTNSNWFTGVAWRNDIVEAPHPSRVTAIRVAFEPGSRTAWHTHPLGQTLYVLSGSGLVGLRNEAPRVINTGDTVWIPPGEEHWHGAGPDTTMEHLAIQEKLDGSLADWLEKVSEEDYLRDH